MTDLVKALLVYFIIVSVIGLLLTVYDKIAAKIAQRHRVPEKVLMTLGALGGALVMYITMRIIRHKTRKKKFMVGLPVMILLQGAAVFGLNYWFDTTKQVLLQSMV